MATLSYQNLPAPENRFSYEHLRDGYRMDFVAGHSGYRAPINSHLRVGAAGGSYVGEDVSWAANKREQPNKNYDYAVAYWYSTLNSSQIRWTKTTLDARTDNILGELRYSLPIVDNYKGLVIAFPINLQGTIGVGNFVIRIKMYDANNTVLFNTAYTVINGAANAFNVGVSAINDGTQDWSIIRFEISVDSYTATAGADRAELTIWNTYVFFPAYRSGANISNDLGKIYPFIQDDSSIAAVGATPVAIKALLNKGLCTRNFNWDNTTLIEGGKKYQLVIPTPNKSITDEDSPISINGNSWYSMRDEDEAVNIFLGEENITGNSDDLSVVAKAADIEEAFYAAAYRDSVWQSPYRLQLVSTFTTTPDYTTTGAGAYPGIAGVTTVYRNNLSTNFGLPAGTYKIRWRVRIPGAVTGEVAWSVNNAAGIFIGNVDGSVQYYRNGRIMAQGDNLVYQEFVGTFTIPAGVPMFRIGLEIAVGTAAAITAAGKLPVFDGIMIYPSTGYVEPTAYNSGYNHPFMIVLATDEDPAGVDMYSLEEGNWVEDTSLPLPYFDLYVTDTTSPAPTPVASPLDSINWTCDCPDEKAMMQSNLGYIQEFLNSFVNYLEKTVQIVSNSKPSEALMVLAGQAEGIDIYTDENVQIIWVNEDFVFMSRFIVYNGEIIEINNFVGSRGYVQTVQLSINNDGSLASGAIETYGLRFTPIVYFSSPAKATIGARLSIAGSYGVVQVLDWVNRKRTNAHGYWDMFAFQTLNPDIHSLLNDPSSRDLSPYTFTFTLEILSAAASGFAIVAGEDAGAAIFTQATVHLHYY